MYLLVSLVFSAVVVARKRLFCFLCGDVLKSCLVSYCIASLVSVGHLLGPLLWLTGKCVQLNWSTILLDGYKKLSLPRQPSRQPLCEALLVRRPKSVKTIDRATPPDRDTGKGYKYRFLFILFLTACFTYVLLCITNSYYTLKNAGLFFQPKCWVETAG